MNYSIFKQIIITMSLLPVLTAAAPKPIQELTQNNLAASAQSIQPFLMSSLQFSGLKASQQQATAAAWGLNSTQYQRYLYFMQHTASGHWYAHLNPAEVLGINAKTDVERQQYARIVAKAAYARAGREIAMQQAYDQAMRDLYPGVKPIATHKPQKITLQKTDAIFVVMGINDIVANTILLPLLKKLEVGQYSALNIYFNDRDLTNESIRHWAKNKNIPVALVTSQQLTLNHDHGQFKTMQKHNKVKPLILLKHQQHWLPLPISAVWQRS